MARNIKVLLVDDNINDKLLEPLADQASNFAQCELIHVTTWDKALKLLDEDPYAFDGLIIDGKGQKSASAKSEDDSFLSTVLPALRDRSRDGFCLPYVIYSGWAEELKRYYADEPIFWKGKDQEEEMLLYLQNAIVINSEVYKCRQLYPNIFELFDLKMLYSKYERDMVDILNATYHNFTGNRSALIKTIRPIFENTFTKLREFDNSLIPDEYFAKGKVEISKIVWHLSGSFQVDKQTGISGFSSKQILSTPSFYLLKTLQDITSHFMHNTREVPSDYLIRSCTNALIEYLLWYKQFVKDNYQK